MFFQELPKLFGILLSSLDFHVEFFMQITYVSIPFFI